MAIENTAVGASDTTIYTSTGDSAVSFVSICNYSTSTVTVSVHIVPSGGTVSDGSIHIKDLEIVAKDTYIVYQGGEKIILGDGDFISVVCSDPAAVTSIVSYIGI